MFYNARWYDPSLGRFTSADTIVPGGVQGYDRYAYTNNNPVKYTDPSGHDVQCTLEDGCWETNNNGSIGAPIIPLNPQTQNDLIYGEDNRRNAFLQAVSRHQNEINAIPGMTVELFLAVASAECGVGNQWDNLCTTNAGGVSADSVMQISKDAPEQFRHPGQYQNTAAGFDLAVTDAIGVFNYIANFEAEGNGREGVENNFTNIPSGAAVKLLLYYNAGGNPIALYAGKIINPKTGKPYEGNQNYVSDVTPHLKDSPFGTAYNDMTLADNSISAQALVNSRVECVKNDSCP